MVYLAAVAVVALAVLAVLADRRADLLLTRFERERQVLLNRIQAPEVAVAQAIEVPEPRRQWVGFDDDEDFHREMAELNGDS